MQRILDRTSGSKPSSITFPSDSAAPGSLPPDILALLRSSNGGAPTRKPPTKPNSNKSQSNRRRTNRRRPSPAKTTRRRPTPTPPTRRTSATPPTRRRRIKPSGGSQSSLDSMLSRLGIKSPSPTPPSFGAGGGQHGTNDMARLLGM